MTEGDWPAMCWISAIRLFTTKLYCVIVITKESSAKESKLSRNREMDIHYYLCRQPKGGGMEITMKKICKAGVLILSFTGFIMIAIFGAVQLYRYHHPQLKITYSVSEDGAISMPRLIISGESMWGCSSLVKKHIAIYSEQESAMERYLLTTYHTPRFISTHVEIKDGQTILTFTGQGILENGTVSEINEQLVFDFILTTDISGP